MTAPAAPAALSVESLNENVRNMQYAVRGEIVSYAARLSAQLKARPGSLPFNNVVLCNIGNPQQLGQKPLSFLR